MAEGANARGTVALVTAGGTGVGLAMAPALAQAGWQVAITGRRTEMLQEATLQMRDEGLATSAVTADASDPTSVKQPSDRIVAQSGRLDLLVSNAGMNSPFLPPLETVFFLDRDADVAVNRTVMANAMPFAGRG